MKTRVLNDTVSLVLDSESKEIIISLEFHFFGEGKGQVWSKKESYYLSDYLTEEIGT